MAAVRALGRLTLNGRVRGKKAGKVKTVLKKISRGKDKNVKKAAAGVLKKIEKMFEKEKHEKD